MSDCNTVKTVAVIPSAGAGVRMGAGRAKQFLDLNGRPLLSLTLEKFQRCPVVHGIVLVVPPGDMDFCKDEILERYSVTKVIKVVPGGARRQDSVRLGIEATGGEYGMVLIHDGVRPCIDSSLIERVVSAAHQYRAVITGLPARETVKEADEGGLVIRTIDRARVWLVQTPQVFRYEDVMTVHQRALTEDWGEMTDDALMMERAGIPVRVIPGSETNIKVTTPYDMELARFLLEREKEQCY